MRYMLSTGKRNIDPSTGPGIIWPDINALKAEIRLRLRSHWRTEVRESGRLTEGGHVSSVWQVTWDSQGHREVLFA